VNTTGRRDQLGTAPRPATRRGRRPTLRLVVLASDPLPIAPPLQSALPFDVAEGRLVLVEASLM
jgi:hypothetical protein